MLTGTFQLNGPNGSDRAFDDGANFDDGAVWDDTLIGSVFMSGQPLADNRKLEELNG